MEHLKKKGEVALAGVESSRRCDISHSDGMCLWMGGRISQFRRYMISIDSCIVNDGVETALRNHQRCLFGMGGMKSAQ